MSGDGGQGGGQVLELGAMQRFLIQISQSEFSEAAAKH